MRLPARVWDSLPTCKPDWVTRSLRSRGVQKTAELVRILNLPRRDLDFNAVEDLTPLFKTPTGTLQLRPIQSAALFDIERAGGLMGSIGVGHGKTLILLLGPSAVHAKHAVLLVPPELKQQLLTRDIPFYSKHFYIETGRFTVLAYSELSATHKGDILEKLKPDWIFADEAHRLKNKNAARTKRFLRYVETHGPNFVALSGSFLESSILDYAHLSRIALRGGSPLPEGRRELFDWASALDPSDDGEPEMPPGALVLLCKDEQEPIRAAYRRRLAETSGWVLSGKQAFSGSLYLRARRPALSEPVQAAIKRLRNDWVLEDDLITEATERARYLRQLACGFYYRWKWEGEPDLEWLHARRGWDRWVAQYLAHNNRAELDSPKLLEEAAIYGHISEEGLAAWRAWEPLKERAAPPVEAVWLGDEIVTDALAWAVEAKQGIIWCRHRAVAAKISEVGNLPLFGQGTDAGTTHPDKDPVIVCSVKAQSEGKNLQAWSRNLMVSPPPNAGVLEQCIGRTHRPGQHNEVWFDVLVHTEENEKSLADALHKASNIHQTQNEQKLLLATKLGWDDES